MAVARALQAASSALRRNPIVVGIVLVISLLQLPSQFAQLAGPIASAAFGLVFTLVMVVVAPFVFGGLIGMAAEALDGSTSLDTFVEDGKRYYRSMFGAYLLLLGGSIVLGFVASLASIALVIGVGVLSGGLSGGMAGGPNSMFVATVFVSTGLFVLILFVPLLFVQFYGQAIVLDGRSAIGGFRRSFALVRSNPVSVVGYSVLVFGAGLIVGLLGSVPSTLLSMRATPVATGVPLPDVSLPVVAGLTVIGNLLLGLLGSLFIAFSVAFYRTLDAPPGGAEPPDRSGTVA